MNPKTFDEAFTEVQKLVENFKTNPEYYLSRDYQESDVRKVSFLLFRQLLPKLRGDFYEPSYVYFKTFPIRTIDFDKQQDKERHDQLVGLVEKMLEAKRKLAEAQTDKDKQFFERFCSSLDAQIDRIVYDLYDLTEEEIAIVEEKG